jgi:lysophospholipase
VTYDLKDLGFSIYILSHRGQGESGRIAREPEIQYVENFSDYVKDLDYFVKNIVNVSPKEPTFLLAHSMGGAIGSIYLTQHPDVFKAAALSAPMFKINLAPFPEPVGFGISALAYYFGYGQSFAITQKTYVRETPAFESVGLSKVRHEVTSEIYQNYPETKMGGVSYQFILTALKALDSLHTLSSQIKTPILLLQAGHDQVVLPEGQNKFCSQITDCKKIIYPESHHRILLERDFIRGDALKQITGFYLNHLKKK